MHCNLFFHHVTNMYMNLQNPTPILLCLETRDSFIMRQQSRRNITFLSVVRNLIEILVLKNLLQIQVCSVL